MKKENKRLSQKDKENIKLKRKKTIAKIVNVFVWVYAIGVSLLLVVGSACSRSYSGASALTSDSDLNYNYNNNYIIDSFNKYDSDIDYRFYMSNSTLSTIRNNSNETGTSSYLYDIPSLETLVNNFETYDINYVNIPDFDNLYIDVNIYASPSYYYEGSPYLSKLAYKGYGSDSDYIGYLGGFNFVIDDGNMSVLPLFWFDDFTDLDYGVNFIASSVYEGGYARGFNIYNDVSFFDALDYFCSGAIKIETKDNRGGLIAIPSDYTGNNYRAVMLLFSLFSNYRVNSLNYSFNDVAICNYLSEYRVQTSSLSIISSPYYNFNYSASFIRYNMASNNIHYVDNYVIKWDTSINNSDYIYLPLETGNYIINGSYKTGGILAKFRKINGHKIVIPNFYSLAYPQENIFNTTIIDYSSHSDYSDYYIIDSVVFEDWYTTNINVYDTLIEISSRVVFGTDLIGYDDFDVVNVKKVNNIKSTYISLSPFNTNLGYYFANSDILNISSDFVFNVGGNSYDIGGTNITNTFIDTFTLINMSLGGILSLFSIYIIPGITIGSLILVPFTFVIALFVIKLFKR